MRLRFDKRQPTDDEEETLRRALQAEVANDRPLAGTVIRRTGRTFRSG